MKNNTHGTSRCMSKGSFLSAHPLRTDWPNRDHLGMFFLLSYLSYLLPFSYTSQVQLVHTARTLVFHWFCLLFDVPFYRKTKVAFLFWYVNFLFLNVLLYVYCIFWVFLCVACIFSSCILTFPKSIPWSCFFVVAATFVALILPNRLRTLYVQCLVVVWCWALFCQILFFGSLLRKIICYGIHWDSSPATPRQVERHSEEMLVPEFFEFAQFAWIWVGSASFLSAQNVSWMLSQHPALNLVIVVPGFSWYY